MGDRVAEYLNFVIMLILTTAVIALGASFMFYGRRMQNMFTDASIKIYTDMDTGQIRDLCVSDPMEMPAASVLSFLYDNEKYIYDVYDNRDITSKVFADSGQLQSVTHENKTGRSTLNEGDTRDKFRVAVSYFSGDMNKKCKIIAKVNPIYSDYYDIYVHDLDCDELDEYHVGSCKKCVKGDSHSGNCCSVSHTHNDIDCKY